MADARSPVRRDRRFGLRLARLCACWSLAVEAPRPVSALVTERAPSLDTAQRSLRAPGLNKTNSKNFRRGPLDLYSRSPPASAVAQANRGLKISAWCRAARASGPHMFDPGSAAAATRVLLRQFARRDRATRGQCRRERCGDEEFSSRPVRAHVDGSVRQGPNQTSASITRAAPRWPSFGLSRAAGLR